MNRRRPCWNQQWNITAALPPPRERRHAATS
jgi:hypothetical protein